jgi:glycosyltransferase involved in cell wall biosynthesis
VRLGAGRNFLKNLLCTGEKAFSIIGVYRHFDSKVACQLRTISPSAVYAYEGGARQTFREAKRMGLTTLYELPSSYWYWEYRFLAMEAERKPEFAGLLPKLKDSPDHMRWKDEELDLADYVIVPSQHVCQTLSGIIPNDKIRIINYGAPPVRPSKLNQFTPTRPLKVIFVGALTQRKGISYLLDAVDMLGPSVSLTMVGRRFCANERVDDYCRRSRWFESLSYNRVLDVMSESDVLVLPSLCEAFGLVVTEALACGLPVIVTPNVGAVDLLVDGREGFIVPLCSAEAIACRLNVLSRDRELLAIMSSRARITAAKRSWKNYRASFAEMIESTI